MLSRWLGCRLWLADRITRYSPRCSFLASSPVHVWARPTFGLNSPPNAREAIATATDRNKPRLRAVTRPQKIPTSRVGFRPILSLTQAQTTSEKFAKGKHSYQDARIEGNVMLWDLDRRNHEESIGENACPRDGLGGAN